MVYTTVQLIRDIVDFVRPYRKRFWLGTFLRLTSDIVWLFPAWAVSEIINLATSYQPGQDLSYFWMLTFGVWLAAIYHFINHDLAKYFIYPIAEQVNLDAQLKGIRHLFKLDSFWHEKENSGNKIQRLSKGGESLNELIRVYIDLFVESTVSVIGVTLILSDLGSVFLSILLFFFVTYFLISFYLTQKASDQAHRANVEWERFDGVVFESINNIATVKSLGLGEGVYRLLLISAQRLMKEIRLRVIRFRTREAILNLYKEFFRQILIFYTVWNVFQGDFEVGVIAMVLLYFFRIEQSAYEFAEISNKFIIGKIAVQRVAEMLNEIPAIENSGTRKFPQHWKSLHLEKVVFSYHRRKVFDELDLTIERGEKVGIVGLSGEGKSTLFKLLLKLYEPQSGVIRFDDVSLHDIKRKTYLPFVAHVPQETELFNLSLKDNIALTSGSKFFEDRFARALAIAHVRDFMDKLPQGADSLIGEKGIRLSGGEKQRVGIARAIYKQPDILFLDEATSHLDIDSEKKIQEALNTVFKGITALVIAHRLSTLKEMDRIVIIHRGRVVEEGSFQQLIRKRGEFWRLWKKQNFSG